jgi:hypothetical protein
MLVQDLKEVDLVKKRSLVMVGVLIFICLFVAVAFANNQVKIVVNGQEIDSDVAPQIIKDRTMVPVRWVAEALGADVRWEPQSKTVYIDKPHYISSNSEADSKLYPFQESNGMYEGFVLEIKGKRQYFDWQNVKNPSFRPQMILKDINHDGGKELIVILTTGTGTGYHTEDIHVLNPASFEEIKVEPAADIVKEKLDSIIEDDAEQKAIHIIIADEKTTVHKEPEYFNSWFDKVVFNNSYHYSLINDELLLSMGAQVAPAGFIGEIEVIYEYKNGVLAAGAFSFKQEDEHEKAISELIRDFGSKLKHVSLLAPEDIVKASMQENYGDYVSPALLAQWENDLQNVPGVVTSSPWPERIEIVDIDKLSDYRYRIEVSLP